MVNANSIAFYFCAMAIFVLEGWALSVVLPFHSHANAKELSSKRLIPLDGLRGLLALSVFSTHASSFYFYLRTNVWESPPSNFYRQLAIAPVSMFFYITGYLFWSKLTGRPKFPAWRFWLGRLGRLAPVYVAACMCAFMFAAHVSGFHRQVSIVKLLSQLARWLAFDGTMDINAVSGSQLWLGAAWSLRYEWLFYFSLPFLGWFACRTRNTLLFVCLAIGLQLALPKWSAADGAGHTHWYLLVKYIGFLGYTFSVGILVATLPLKRFARWAQGRVASLISIAAVAIALLWLPPNFGPLESVCLAIPFACICLGNTWFGLFSSTAMRFLGRISYSFYLLHFLGLTVVLTTLQKRGLLNSIVPLQYWMIVSGVGMGTILVCAFSYQWLEHPFLHVGQGTHGGAQSGREEPEPGSCC